MIRGNLTRLFLFALGVGTTTLMSRCKMIDPKEKVPTYVHIDSFQFETSDLHDIRYAWVYYNNNPIGAFDLPATVPVMASGSGEIKVLPGIPINGRGERPVAYPFYKGYTTVLNEAPGQIVNIAPSTRYFDSTKFLVISEFEAGISKFAKVAGSTTIISSSDPAIIFQGTGTGAVFLNTSADSTVDSTRSSFKVGLSAAFIEFDYKTSVNAVFGIRGVLSGVITTDIEYLAGVLPNSSWNKFYLNVTSFVNKYQGGDYYLFIKTNVPSGQTNGQLLIDNIKLVTF